MKLDVAALDAAVKDLFNKQRLPGMAVCLRTPEGEVFCRGYGFRDGEKTLPVTQDTVFGVASMSKSTVTLALALLELEGKGSFEDPVVRYFPQFRVPGTPPESVLVKHLATHTAGIPPLETLEWSAAMNNPALKTENAETMRKSAPNAMQTIEQVIDYVANAPYPTVCAPGERISYSNDGYAILSYIADQVAGERLEDFLDRRVFSPLGMKRTVLETGIKRAAELAEGNITSLFERDKDGEPVADDEWELMPPFRACACVKSTARDMAAYYQCLSQHGVLEGRQVLPEQVTERMVGAAFPLRERPFYCFGLNKRSFCGHTLCHHGGALHGVSSYGGFLLDEGVSFAVLSSASCEDMDAIGELLLDAALGLPLGSDHAWLRPVSGRCSTPEMLTGRFVGHEASPEIIEITEDGAGGIRLQNNGETLQTEYCGGTWYLAKKDGVLQNRAHVLVHNGKAWAVRWGSRVFMRED